MELWTVISLGLRPDPHGGRAASPDAQWHRERGRDMHCKNVGVWKDANLSCTFCMTRDVCDAGASVTDFLRVS